jgi:UDP-N-acetylglucosamine 2-epimerase (non-hydrolysing)
MAPVVTALRAAPFDVSVAVSGQHRSMLDQVNQAFGIEPDYDLNILSQGQSLTEITGKSLAGLDEIMRNAAPDAVIVQGDTTTTMSAALAAFYHRVPVVHVEAGLRTDDRYSPYPEEINRRLTTQLTRLHLAPTPLAAQNLVRDGVASEDIVVTGNTVIDALLQMVNSGAALKSELLEKLSQDERRVLLVTAHRRESWGSAMESIGRALADLAATFNDMLIVFPIHRNPVVRNSITPLVEHLGNVWLLEPLGYTEFAGLMQRAHVILTDSGGIQEEGPSLGKPVLVMRDTTERPEAISAGTAKLIGTDNAAIHENVSQLWTSDAAYSAMANAVNPYGDGRGAERSVAAIGHMFGMGPAPLPFCP